MVKVEPGYKCPICGHRYEKRISAEECIQDHNDEEPIPSELYKCEMCDDTFQEEEEAEDCEKKHKQIEDRHYINWVEQKNKEELIAAAQNPNQKKLIGV
jgi:rubredoxin